MESRIYSSIKFFFGIPRRIILLCFLFIVVHTLNVLAQIQTNAPIEGFILPRYNDDGYKIFELRGSQVDGYAEGKNDVNIHNMELRTFSGNEARIRQVTINSPLAHISLDKHEARGNGKIEVQGPGYQVYGEDWAWFGKDQRVEIQKNVRVIFTEDMNNILQLR